MKKNMGQPFSVEGPHGEWDHFVRSLDVAILMI